MKVTRKRNGYVIRCSDGEFDALKAMTDGGLTPKALSGSAKNGHTRRVKGGEFLRIDIDNRDREYANPSSFSR